MKSILRHTLLLCLFPGASAFANPLTIWPVIADSPTAVLPDTVPEMPPTAPELLLVATPGEYESSSFAVRSSLPYENFAPLPPILRSVGGELPAGAVQLRYVLCHWQSGSAWDDLPRIRGRRRLIPELLVHDPGLLRVDRSRQTNEVRLQQDDQVRYVDMSTETDSPLTIWNADLPVEDFPLADADSLVSAPLPEAFTRQFMFTIQVPEDAQPGLYRGEIRFQADGIIIASLPLKVRVLPFRLPEARTYHDLEQPFFANLYSYGCIGSEQGNLVPLRRSRQQLTAEFRNLAAHGALYAGLYQGQLSLDSVRLREVLELRQECGLATRPVFFLGPENNLGCGADSSPESLQRLGERVEELCDLVEAVYGHRDVYFYGIDEAGGDTVTQQQPLWQTIHDHGGKVFAAGFRAKTFEAAGNLLDMIVCGGWPSAEESQRWHEVGHKIMAYGIPQTAVENPAVYRYNYGLGLWRAGYDGVMPYAYYSINGHPWNDFDSSLRDMNLVYPTADGVIDTLAWEAFREALDDIRYATLLGLSIRDAAPEKAGIAAEAAAWFRQVDLGSLPPQTIRLRLIDYILQLRKQP